MLYYNTITPLLKSSLELLMNSKEFSLFKLVGGTALSLQLGHRLSVDIDLFTDANYGSIDFKNLEKFLENNFPFVDEFSNITSIGKSYIIGENKSETIKLDVFYTDSFINSEIVKNNIRMASLEDITAMKLEVVQNIGRKKDFWDLHELLEYFSIQTMLELHQKRYPYSHERDLIIENLTNFSLADEQFDVICLKGKYWELIKLDIEHHLQNFTNQKP